MYEHSRPKGFVSWQPRDGTQVILDQVQQVLDRYREHWPLTLRQVFYSLVAVHGYEKTDKAYKRLGEYLVRARRAEIIPFEAMRDDGWSQTRLNHFDDAADFWQAVEATAKRYRRDKQRRQGRWLVILCEAAGMVPQIERVATPYSVPVFSSGGFDSLTVKKELADRIAAEGRMAILLHIGDLDPSGVCIFDAVAADVTAFAEGAEVCFERIALTEQQVERYRLPTAPAKESDRRGNGVADTCQAEALPPDVLAEIVQQAIEENTDVAVLRDDQATEARERADILAALEEVQP